MDMLFYWVQDQICQVNYNVFWKQVVAHFSDYFTKHYPHHNYFCIPTVYIHFIGNENNAGPKVFYSSHNISQKND